MNHDTQRHHGAGRGTVVFVDFYLAADGVHVDHVSTSLPQKIARRLPETFDSAQQGRGVVGQFVFGLPEMKHATASIVFTSHPAPANH